MNSNITSASLSLFNCSVALCATAGNGYKSPSSSEFVDLFDFTGSQSALINGTGGVATFNDLGDGQFFSSKSVSSADDGAFVSFTVNTVGLQAITVARGNTFVAGSTMRLGNAPVEPPPPVLTVPESNTVLLFASGLLGVVAVAKKQSA